MKPLASIVLALALAPLGVAEDKMSPDLESFKDSVVGTLKTYCVECHGAKKQKGDVRLDDIDGRSISASCAQTADDIDNNAANTAIFFEFIRCSWRSGKGQHGIEPQRSLLSSVTPDLPEIEEAVR